MTIHDDMPTTAWPEEAAKLRQALHDNERQLQAHKGCDMTDRYWEGTDE